MPGPLDAKACFKSWGGGHTKDCIQNVGRLSDDQILDLIQGSWSMQVKMLGRSDRVCTQENAEIV